MCLSKGPDHLRKHDGTGDREASVERQAGPYCNPTRAPHPSHFRDHSRDKSAPKEARMPSEPKNQSASSHRALQIAPFLLTSCAKT